MPVAERNSEVDKRGDTLRIMERLDRLETVVKQHIQGKAFRFYAWSHFQARLAGRKFIIPCSCFYLFIASLMEGVVRQVCARCLSADGLKELFLCWGSGYFRAACRTKQMLARPRRITEVRLQPCHLYTAKERAYTVTTTSFVMFLFE